MSIDWGAIGKALDPTQNGVASGLQNAGNTIADNLDPNKNGVADAFKNLDPTAKITEVFNKVNDVANKVSDVSNTVKDEMTKINTIGTIVSSFGGRRWQQAQEEETA